MSHSASFRSHLTMDTLAVQLCTSSLPTRTQDFHPLERAHGAQTKKASDPKVRCLIDKAHIVGGYYGIQIQRSEMSLVRSCIYVE